jgi:hypothetical protein
MRRGVAVWTMGALLLAGAGLAVADEGNDLSLHELRAAMSQNRAMADYVHRNGLPDLAERVPLATRPPWGKYQIALYYLDQRTEIGFARAYILGRPDIEIERYEKGLTDAQVAELAPRAHRWNMGPVARAEDAARRAEAAAARVDAAAGVAERAADRAEAVVRKMEESFHRSLRK